MIHLSQVPLVSIPKGSLGYLQVLENVSSVLLLCFAVALAYHLLLKVGDCLTTAS